MHRTWSVVICERDHWKIICTMEYNLYVTYSLKNYFVLLLLKVCIFGGQVYKGPL